MPGSNEEMQFNQECLGIFYSQRGTSSFLSGPGSWPGPGGPLPVLVPPSSCLRSRWPWPGPGLVPPPVPCRAVPSRPPTISGPGGPVPVPVKVPVKRITYAVWPVSVSPPCRGSVGPAPAPAPGHTVCCLHHVLVYINKQLYMVCFKGTAKIGPSCRDARQVCGCLCDFGRKDSNKKA